MVKQMLYKKTVAFVLFTLILSVSHAVSFRYFRGEKCIEYYSKEIAVLSIDQKKICYMYLSLYPEHNPDLTEKYFIETSHKLYNLSKNSRVLWDVFHLDYTFFPSFIRDVYMKSALIPINEKIKVLINLMKKYKELDDLESIEIICDLYISKYQYNDALQFIQSFYKTPKFYNNPFYHRKVAKYFLVVHECIFKKACKNQNTDISDIWDGTKTIICDMKYYDMGIKILNDLSAKYPDLSVGCHGMISEYEIYSNSRLKD